MKLECILQMGSKDTARTGLFEFLCRHFGVQPRRASFQPPAAAQELNP